MEQNDNIIACRKQLTTALGQNAFSYWNFHKDWFRGKLTRAEFDKGCRNLLTTNEMNMIHNQFVALLIRRLQISASSLQIDHNHPNLNTGLNAREKDRLALTKNYLDTQNDEQEEIPNEALNKQETGNLYNEMLTNRFAAQELILPDKRMILGRIILTSWSHDLEGTDTKDRVADVIAEATKILLKNIITAVIQNRTTYRNFDRHFQYDYGCDVPDPRCKITKDITDEWNDHYIPSYKYANKKSIWDLRQSQSCKRRELELIYKAAASPFKLKEPKLIGIRELYDTLKANCNLIPHHVVYNLTMERIITSLEETD